MPSAVASPARNPAIDALRGLAIVLVVLHHLALRIPLKHSDAAQILPDALINALSYSGYEAVFVFFVISGFLIARHALQRWGALHRIDLGDFYRRRAARILPGLLALLAVLSLLHLAAVPWYVIDRPGQSLAGALVSALGLHLNWYEGRTGWLPGGWDVLWSLSVEEAFYIGFPLFALLLRQRALLLTALGLLALSLPFSRAALAGNEIWQEKAYLPGMAAIATGVLAALLARHWTPGRPASALLRLLGALGIGAVLLLGGPLWRLLGDGLMLLLTAATALFLLGAVAHDHRRGGRASAWLRACGRLSYEIYLTHMFVVFASLALWQSFGIAPRHGHLAYLPVLALSIALGWLFARVLTQPCEAGLRRRWKAGPNTRLTDDEAAVAVGR